ncbi:putative maltose permease (MalP) [Fusarium austroafricanum]|uniref:Putative maltose permease (MalP) n=1 Tax=Fusarium austroafricanum TaxID=2364996 RepID=A0A8H4P0L0_9HYPO|nr:putative maltose permease (MalP) [Fusarium austroafricanum]
MFGSGKAPSDTGSTKDEIVLLPVQAKSGILRVTEIETKVHDPNHNTNAPVPDPTFDLPDNHPNKNAIEVLWIPRGRESHSSDDTGEKVRRALNNEKEMTILGCCKQFPKAIFWSLLLFLTVVMEGYDKSLVAGFVAFPAFRRRYGEMYETANGPMYEISPLWQTALQVSAIACEVLGLLLHGWVTYRIGYKKMMLISLAWMCLAVFPAFFAHNIAVLVASQALCGISWGVIQTLAATYAAEVVPSAIRAHLLSMTNMCWVIGQLLGTGILRSLVHNDSEWSYRIPFALQWAFAVPLFIGIIFAPESPWWLIRRERKVEARHALQRLTKQSHLDIDDTIAIMEHTNRIERKLNYGGSSYMDLFKGANLRRTEISCMVWSVQALCGWILTGYAPYFLEQAGFDSSKSFSLSTGMYGMALVGGMISWGLLTHIGRRKLYLVGLVAAVFMLALGGILSVVLHGQKGLNWSLGAILITTTFLYNLSIGPTCYVIVAEIPSTRLRVKTIALARVVYNIFMIINNIIVPQMLNPTAWNMQGKSCFIYAGTALLCLVYCYFRLPETKGLSYLELDMLFEKGAPTAKFKELQQRLANSAYLTVDRAERMRNAWHGWLTYS